MLSWIKILSKKCHVRSKLLYLFIID